MNVLCGAREDTGEMQAARFTIHNQIPAYLLDRLDFHDRAVFEEHLVACTECQEELGGLSATAAMLDAAPPGHVPPPGLRARTLAAVRRAAAEPGDGNVPRGEPSPAWFNLERTTS